ncbi:MAG: hypothetical protein IIC71_13825 [Acidobacteria bacterium]|nr:hypothetical protein [Acidobacteriota bacterium]
MRLRRRNQKTTLEVVQNIVGPSKDEHDRRIRNRLRSLEGAGFDEADAEEVEARLRNLFYGKTRDSA